MTNSQKSICFREEAKRYLSRMEDVKEMLSNHKPSIGVVGEQLLCKLVNRFLPSSRGLCQGFVMHKTSTGKEQISKQCDLIIYRKNKNSIQRDYGNIKIVSSEFVDAVIEVKSSIQRKTFDITLESFELLSRMGVINKYLFIYGKTSFKSLSNYLLPSNNKFELEDFSSTGVGFMDWDYLERLPQAILTLGDDTFYSLEDYPFNNGDGKGYLSHIIKDGQNKKVCSLALFLEYISHQVNGDLKVDISKLSYDKGIALCYY